MRKIKKNIFDLRGFGKEPCFKRTRIGNTSNDGGDGITDVERSSNGDAGAEMPVATTVVQCRNSGTMTAVVTGATDHSSKGDGILRGDEVGSFVQVLTK